jgi:hypothetical protein
MHKAGPYLRPEPPLFNASIALDDFVLGCLVVSLKARAVVSMHYFSWHLRKLDALRGMTQVVPGTNGLNPIARSLGDLEISRADLIPFSMWYLRCFWVSVASAVTVATPHVHEAALGAFCPSEVSRSSFGVLSAG